MTQLYEINVKLSDNQKKNLSNAYHKKETIILRLTKDSLVGNDTLYVPQNIVKRLAKNRKSKKGIDIKLANKHLKASWWITSVCSSVAWKNFWSNDC